MYNLINVIKDWNLSGRRLNSANRIQKCNLTTINSRRHKGGSSLDFLALNFYSLTNYQKLWHNCSLFVKTSFDSN